MARTKIYYLAEAIRDHGIGPVVTVIEQKGISGWDRFGRHLPIDDAKICDVLDILAESHQVETVFELEATLESDGFPPPSPIEFRTDDFDRNDPLWHFGWIDELRPAFPVEATLRKQAEERKAMKQRDEWIL
ncbi:MAG: UPF0261 family protein [Betaproteobacteria bacterium]|nr:UPF0261 family protein [Betaproteobacteria bacterium]